MIFQEMKQLILQIESLKNEEYPPSEDTFFITENIENENFPWLKAKEIEINNI